MDNKSPNTLSYNREGNILICGHETKYTIFKLVPKLEKHTETNMDRIIKKIRILDNTNMILVLYTNLNTKISNNVVLWDDSFKKNLVEINLKDDIKNIFIVRNNLIFILEKMVCVFDYKGNLKFSHNTYCNELGIACASNNLISTLGEIKGTIVLMDCDNNYNVNNNRIIKAHNNNIQHITFNDDETLIATASEMGTNIHVFDMNTKELKYKLRRGINKAKINSISFNFENTLLACSSNSKTVHVFKLEDNKVSNTLMSFMSVPDYFNTSNTMNWSFSQIQIDEKNVIKFSKDGTLNIVTLNGSYYKTSHKTNYMNVIRKDLHL